MSYQGHVVDLGDPLADGEVQITQDQDGTQEDIQLDLGNGHTEQGHPDAVHRENDIQQAHDGLGYSLPNTHVGFPVILFHDLFHVGGGADVNFRFHGFLVLYVHSVSFLQKQLPRLLQLRNTGRPARMPSGGAAAVPQSGLAAGAAGFAPPHPCVSVLKLCLQALTCR